jgi:hypothetical protein
MTGTELVVRQSFNMEAMRAFLIALREDVGSDSNLGHRCSNLVEQIKNYYLSESLYQRGNLQYLIARSVFEIKSLRMNQEMKALSRPQILLEFMPSGIQ